MYIPACLTAKAAVIMRSSDMNCFLRRQQCQSAFGLFQKIQRVSYNPLAVCYIGHGYLLRKCFSGRHLNIVCMNPDCHIRT